MIVAIAAFFVTLFFLITGFLHEAIVVLVIYSMIVFGRHLMAEPAASAYYTPWTDVEKRYKPNKFLNSFLGFIRPYEFEYAFNKQGHEIYCKSLWPCWIGSIVAIGYWSDEQKFKTLTIEEARNRTNQNGSRLIDTSEYKKLFHIEPNKEKELS